jgi:hypothetical protein
MPWLQNSALIIALVSALWSTYLNFQVSKQIADLEHRPAFVSESLAFVQEFTAFYDEQSQYFRDLSDSSDYSFENPKRKAFLEDTVTKFFNAAKQADRLELKATQYFHGTEWLEMFEETRKIWKKAATPTTAWFEKLLKPELTSYSPSDVTGPLGVASKQLSDKTAELLARFVLLLKSLPAESSVFQHIPPTPTPNPDIWATPAD